MQQAPCLVHGFTWPGYRGAVLKPTEVAGRTFIPGLPSSNGNSVAFRRGHAAQERVWTQCGGPTYGHVYCFFFISVEYGSYGCANDSANIPFAAFMDESARAKRSIARIGSRILTKKVGSGYVWDELDRHRQQISF